METVKCKPEDNQITASLKFNSFTNILVKGFEHLSNKEEVIVSFCPLYPLFYETRTKDELSEIMSVINKLIGLCSEVSFSYNDKSRCLIFKTELQYESSYDMLSKSGFRQKDLSNINYLRKCGVIVEIINGFKSKKSKVSEIYISLDLWKGSNFQIHSKRKVLFEKYCKIHKITHVFGQWAL